MIQRTLILLKPDAVKRCLISKIIERFENIGLKIVAMKMVWPDKELAKKHYESHVGKDFYAPLEEFITSGPVIAMVLEGINAVEVARKIVGHTDPSKALPGTIRGDFAHHSMEYANSQKKSIANLVHASSSKEEAEKEIIIWFSKEEIHNYKTVHEEHVF